MSTLIRLLLCLVIAGIAFYKYIDKINELTELQMSIPLMAKEVKELQERNMDLQFEIEKFESPAHLMELARRPEYGHLHYPINQPIIEISCPLCPKKKSD